VLSREIKTLAPNRIRVPWMEMEQFRTVCWRAVRRRVTAMRSKEPEPKRRRLGESCVLGSDGPLEVLMNSNGSLSLQQTCNVHEWLAASLTASSVDVVISRAPCKSVDSLDTSQDATSDENRRRGNTIHESTGVRSTDVCIVPQSLELQQPMGVCSMPQSLEAQQPRVLQDSGKWLIGDIDARGVCLLHAKPPRWPKVLEYADRLEEQLALGSPERPPPVQISMDPLREVWVANDGAHRLYASLLVGAHLRCKWKKCQRGKEVVGEEAQRHL